MTIMETTGNVIYSVNQLLLFITEGSAFAISIPNWKYE